MIAAYFSFEALPEAVKFQHKIISKVRLDCTKFANPTGYTGLTDFVNTKGLMFLYKTPARELVKSNSKRMAEWALSNGKLNLSSIYFEDTDYPEYGYGYPNANRLLSNKEPNPLFPFRNDCYLFLTNADLSSVEVLIIMNGRNMVSAYYQNFIEGGLEQELLELRVQAQPFFDYERSL